VRLRAADVEADNVREAQNCSFDDERKGMTAEL
jgi:hypothetical protein